MPIHRTLFFTFATISFFMGSSAFAGNEDFGKSAVAQSLMKQISLTPNAQTTQIIQPFSNRPWQLEENIPEDIDAIMRNLEAQNTALVQEFEQLLKKDPQNPDAPKWLYQIAEFHWQTSHYAYLRARRAWLAAQDKCLNDESACPPEPVANYQQAIDNYRRILANYPNDAHTDEVLFRLGDALIRNQQPKEGITYLNRLVQNYPEYKSIDAAWLAIGEFYFSQKITGTAQAAYQKLTENYPHSPFYTYAQYKLAWTYLNLADDDAYRQAIALFKQVIETIDTQYGNALNQDGQIDENKLQQGEVSFRNQALNDLSTTYAELPNGWKEARNYLYDKLPQTKAQDKIEQLGSILESQGKFEEALELYEDLITQYPAHPHLVDWYGHKINAYKAANLQTEALQETEVAVHALLPTNIWWQKNQQDKNAIHKAYLFNEQNLYALSIHSIENAETAANDEERQNAWNRAENFLRLEITHYAKNASAFDIYYSFAYVLDEQSDLALHLLKKQHGQRLKTEPQIAEPVLHDLNEAAHAYQTIIDWNPESTKSDQIRIAANRQIFVYANVLAISDPDWSMANSAKTQSFVEEKRGSAILKKEALTNAELNFVRSVEQFASRYPTDPETAAFLWRAAEIYRTHHDYEQAAQRFDQIITHFPNHQYAAVSVGSMFELYTKANNYEKIEYWANWLINHKNFKHYTLQELQDTVAFAIDQQATHAMSNGNFQTAIATLMRIEDKCPTRPDLIAAARFKAATFKESNKQYKAANALLRPLAEDSYDNPIRMHANYQMAINHLKLANFETAAKRFENVALLYDQIFSKNQKPTVTKDGALEFAKSVYYGVQLYKNLNLPSQAAKLLERYTAYNDRHTLDLYQSGNELILQTPDKTEASQCLLSFSIAQMERAKFDQPQNAMTRLENLEQTLNEENAPINQRLNLRFQIIQTAIDTGLNDIAKQKLATLTPIDTWSPAQKAQYHYLQGRYAQKQFEAIQLTFPIKVLRNRIEAKAKQRQLAEKNYRMAINFKNAQVSTASAYELAQMALHFRDAFKNLPAPKELENDPETLDAYTTWIEDELIYPAEDAAAAMLESARQISTQLQFYTKQTLQSAKTLAELKPSDYPVTQISTTPEK